MYILILAKQRDKKKITFQNKTKNLFAKQRDKKKYDENTKVQDMQE